ncbi:MAG: PAS domain-containing protein, partial [Rhodocyclaceae bacterium]|nr:PAS domain-containing protein [Rhodocyclaceae bacterium]
MEKMSLLLHDDAPAGMLAQPGNESAASLIVDAEGRILHATPAAEWLFQAQPGGLTGRACGFPFRVGETGEIEILRPEGERLIAATHCLHVDWQGQRAFRLDLTVQPHRRPTRLGNALLRTLVAYSPLAIVAADLSGKVMLWNHAAVRLFGISELDMRGQKLPGQHATHTDTLWGLFERALGGEALLGVEVSGLLNFEGAP